MCDWVTGTILHPTSAGNAATHVSVDAEDAATHDDPVIQDALCDECYDYVAHGVLWIHKADQ